jgi:4-alpha-glucanotransferase
LRGPAELPNGYHRLYVRIGALDLESYLFCAPVRAYAPDDHRAKRWGLFCPLYALHSEHSWGAGDFSDLAELCAYTAELGGHAVATLPMLASFLDEPFNLSPYAPVSRIFWNEFYLDVEAIPDLQDCPAAKSIISSTFAGELRRLSSAPLVQYRELMALKRRVLEALADWLLRQDSERRARLDLYSATHPAVQEYAAFRAKTEREGKSWLLWPAAGRDATLRPEDYQESAKNYHLYVQWQCEEQIAALRNKAGSRGVALYLDFPLGVNRDGYDVWRERELFALGMSGGAPPDGLFIKGQNWGFPPLHPEKIRQQGYRYYIECLRHHMQCAGILRIDHVMGLHRAFWVPDGFSASDGVYVHYRAPEFYAILNLESQRHQVQIVGENLGTVPDYVNQAMVRHNIHGMHVAQFGVHPEPARSLDETPPRVVASLNTHDTATFMGFWEGLDIDDRMNLGLLNEVQAENERRSRAAQRQALGQFLRSLGLIDGEAAAAVLNGWLTYLAGQDEEFLLINLEDLWLEPAPQNVPGTWRERPNWQRKSRHSLEEIRDSEVLRTMLKSVSDIRRRMS